jgi:hypothetical protein
VLIGRCRGEAFAQDARLIGSRVTSGIPVNAATRRQIVVVGARHSHRVARLTGILAASGILINMISLANASPLLTAPLPPHLRPHPRDILTCSFHMGSHARLLEDAQRLLILFQRGSVFALHLVDNTQMFQINS